MVVLVLGSAALALINIHPYELSYYNELVGGPRGAWERGFELTYWYDAFNPRVIDDLNQRFPPHAQVDFLNKKTDTALPVFYEYRNLKALRSDIILQELDENLPYVWLLTQDSKAFAFTRLLFAMRPWYASEPRQLSGAQGRHRERSRGRVARAGPGDPARRPGSQASRAHGCPRMGQNHRALARASLGRRPDQNAPARAQPGDPRVVAL